ncbi:MAG: TonB-dependent siderophore receptor [Verrucomicrobiales bacterium]|nr:TonB-dependent siderophore receptor [Verrucomicrobiales bacterium]
MKRIQNQRNAFRYFNRFVLFLVVCPILSLQYGIAQGEAEESAQVQQLERTVVESVRPVPARAPTQVRRTAPAPAPVPEPLIIDDEVPEMSYGDTSSSTALFGSTPLIETPFSVGVIDQEMIQERRAFSAEEALLYEPSVTRPYGGGFYNRADFSIRGFAPDTLQSYRIDGLPLINMAEPAIDDKERIEVLKGPAGLRFGFVPPGGAINYVRKRPTEELSRSISTDVDTFGGIYSQIDISDTLSTGGGNTSVSSAKNPWGKNASAKSPVEGGGTLGYRFVIAGDNFDSYYDNAGGDRLHGSAFLEWKPNDDVSIWTSISGQNRERNGYGGILVSGTGTVFDTGVDSNLMQRWGHNRQESLDFAVGADIQLDDGWMIRTSTSYGEVDRSGYQSWPGPVIDTGDFADFEWLIGTQSWEYWSHHTHLEGELYTGPLKHEFVVGGEYRYIGSSRSPEPRGSNLIGINNVYNLQDLPPLGSDPQGSVLNYEDTEFSFFATDTVELTDWLSVLGGVRYAEIESKYLDPVTGAVSSSYHESVLSPTAAVMFEPAEDVHAYVSYTQGMTMGGTAPLMAVNALENMPPIESSQIEVGVKAELLDDRLYGEFAYFNIEQDLEYLNDDRVYTQDGLRVHEGFEFQLRGQLTDSLQAGVSAMILDADQKDTGDPFLNGRIPDNVPEYKATAWLDWEVPQVPGLALSLNTVFVGERFADSYEQFAMDEYFLINAGARYRFETVDKDWTLRLYLENLSDERYFYAGSFIPGYNGQLEYGAPVSATFSVQVDF